MAWARCGDHSHWGPYGAAGLLLTDEARGELLLQLRSAQVLDAHTWALPGGALERGETPTEGALREAFEETGLTGVEVRGTLTGLVHPAWTYTYVLATTPSPDLPPHESWEAAQHLWVPVEEVAGRPDLHPNLAADWPRLRAELAAGGAGGS